VADNRTYTSKEYNIAITLSGFYCINIEDALKIACYDGPKTCNTCDNYDTSNRKEYQQGRCIKRDKFFHGTYKCWMWFNKKIAQMD